MLCNLAQLPTLYLHVESFQCPQMSTWYEGNDHRMQLILSQNQLLSGIFRGVPHIDNNKHKYQNFHNFSLTQYDLISTVWCSPIPCTRPEQWFFFCSDRSSFSDASHEEFEVWFQFLVRVLLYTPNCIRCPTSHEDLKYGFISCNCITPYLMSFLRTGVSIPYTHLIVKGVRLLTRNLKYSSIPS